MSADVGDGDDDSESFGGAQTAAAATTRLGKPQS